MSIRQGSKIIASMGSMNSSVDLSNYALKSDLTSKQDKLTAGTGIKIENNVVSNTQTSAEWGKISGDISSQTDLKAVFDDKIGKTGDDVKDGSLILVGTLGVEADTDNLPPDSWRLNTSQPGVYKMGYRFVGGEGIFFSDYNFKYDSTTLDSETIISNTNLGGTFGSNIKLTSSTSGGYSEVSLNADQAKAPNPETGDMEKIATYDWVENATSKKADLNLGNSTAITNCITEIPQDIKLEIANNQFVAKAGSKALIPNGFESDGVTPKFDEFIINSDISANMPTGNFTQMIFVRTDNTITARTAPLTCFSGASAPSGYTNMAWYDTTNNLMKLTADSGSTWTAGFSLPLGIYTTKADYIANIDQVFNGFGYIGSTVFALPGVKGLIPNGRNADGSLKNIEFTVNNVLTTTTLSSYSATIVLGSGWINCSGSYSYNEVSNFNYEVNTIDNNCIAGYCEKGTDGKITSFNSKQTFQAVDKNDTSWLSSLGMPSARHIDLTLGASGTRYTAPANGYCFLEKNTGTTGKYITITNETTKIAETNSTSLANATLRAYVQAKKGDSILVTYTATGETKYFRFVYAEGENN